MGSGEISFPLFGEGFIINPPSYVTVFGFDLYLYGLFIALGFILAGLYLYKRRNALGLSNDNVLDLIILAVPCGIIGARLYFALFNISDYVGQGNWLNIFRIREGGLAIYGGVIGGALAFYVYSRRKKVPIGKLLDAAGFGLFIGQAVGRWGNFFNREAFGSVTDLPWKMGLTRGTDIIYVHPTFLYELLWNTVGFILMHIISKKKKNKYYGQFFLLYAAWYGLGRYMIEGLRTDSLFVAETDIRVSQLLALLSFSAAIVLLLRNHMRGSHFPDGWDDPVPAEGPIGDTEDAEASDSDDEDTSVSENGDNLDKEAHDNTDMNDITENTD